MNVPGVVRGTVGLAEELEASGLSVLCAALSQPVMTNKTAKPNQNAQDFFMAGRLHTARHWVNAKSLGFVFEKENRRTLRATEEVDPSFYFHRLVLVVSRPFHKVGEKGEKSSMIASLKQQCHY